jgi:LPS sulfotransferase NodH
MRIAGEQCLLFCATQRTGSGMVCDDFRNLAGADAGSSEILYNRIVRAESKKAWNDLWPIIKAEGQVQQFFFSKIMFHYLPKISAFISGDTSHQTPRAHHFTPDLVRDFMAWFGKSEWVFIDRADIIAQTTSLYFAHRTGVWSKKQGYPFEEPNYEDIPYDFARLKIILHELTAEKSHWAQFFQNYDIEPIMIDYECAAKDFPNYLSETFDAIGLQMRPSRPRRMQKMGGAANERLAKRFREDLSYAVDFH